MTEVSDQAAAAVLTMAGGRLWLGQPHSWWSERGMELSFAGLRTWRPWLTRRVTRWAQIRSVELTVRGSTEGSSSGDVLKAVSHLVTSSDLLDLPHGLLLMTVRGHGFAEVRTHEADGPGDRLIFGLVLGTGRLPRAGDLEGCSSWSMSRGPIGNQGGSWAHLPTAG